MPASCEIGRSGDTVGVTREETEMSLLQRTKDALPADLMRKLRVARHSRANSLSRALMTLDPGVRVIFDVGANVGDTALSFLRWFPRATVYAFEPATELFSAMNARVGEAGFADRLQGHQVGFYDKQTQADLHLTSSSGANSIMAIGEAYHAANPEIETDSTETISLVRMDDFVRAAGVKHIDLVKIDVEGVEHEVLLGGNDTFRSMVDAVILEISFVRHERSEGNYVELFRTMHELGFAPAYMFDIEQSTPGTPWRLAQLDCVFRKY
jgi:FkbM family methyltransferase